MRKGIVGKEFAPDKKTLRREIMLASLSLLGYYHCRLGHWTEKMSN